MVARQQQEPDAALHKPLQEAHSAPRTIKHQFNKNNRHNELDSSARLDVKSPSTVLIHSWRILRLAFRQKIPRAKATSHPLTAIFLAFYLPDLAAV